MKSTCLFVLGLFMSVIAGMAAGQTLRGVVTHVEDGDTLTLTVAADQYKVRLADIDAPETCHKSRDRLCRKAGQPGGEEAAQRLRELALNQPAFARCRDRSYERIVCYVEVGGRDMSYALAEHGLAWWEDRYGKDVRIKQAVETAQARKLGIWATGRAFRPADWRHVCWKDNPTSPMCLGASL